MLNRSKQKGSKFEKKVQKQISSGAIWFAPLDLSTDEHLIECKYTDQKGYRITKTLLDKIWNSALSKNKIPGLIIGIKRDEASLYTLRCELEITRKG